MKTSSGQGHDQAPVQAEVLSRERDEAIARALELRKERNEIVAQCQTLKEENGQLRAMITLTQSRLNEILTLGSGPWNQPSEEASTVNSK